MGNMSLKVLEKSLDFLFKKGYEPCLNVICTYFFLFVLSVTIPPENEGDEREEEEDAIPGQ